MSSSRLAKSEKAESAGWRMSIFLMSVTQKLAFSYKHLLEDAVNKRYFVWSKPKGLGSNPNMLLLIIALSFNRNL
jgi:hypothetical protein